MEVVKSRTLLFINRTCVVNIICKMRTVAVRCSWVKSFPGVWSRSMQYSTVTSLLLEHSTLINVVNHLPAVCIHISIWSILIIPLFSCDVATSTRVFSLTVHLVVYNSCTHSESIWLMWRCHHHRVTSQDMQSKYSWCQEGYKSWFLASGLDRETWCALGEGEKGSSGGSVCSHDTA